MTYYAEYDSTIINVPSPVIGWYDTDFNYPILPSNVNLFELTEAQWIAHVATPNGWAIYENMIQPYTASVPAIPFTQQIQNYIEEGINITSTTYPALNGVYSVSSYLPFGRQDIATEAQFISTFNEFTNSTTELTWPLLNNTPVVFPNTASFLLFAKAAGQFYSACQAAALTQSGVLPVNTYNIG
jgi:hypothetical protein